MITHHSLGLIISLPYIIMNICMIKHITCTNDVANFSDHLPLHFCLALHQPLELPSKHAQATSGRPSETFPHHRKRVSSDHSTAYSEFFHDHLPVIPDEVFSCCDPKCQYHLLHSLCLQLLLCILTAADLYLPKANIKKSVVPGWNTHARFFRQAAAFSHKVWTECGHPTSGVLFQIKKKTLKHYKYEVHRLQRQHEHIIRERLGIALS